MYNLLFTHGLRLVPGHLVHLVLEQLVASGPSSLPAVRAVAWKDHIDRRTGRKREIMKNSQVLHIFICEFFDSKCSSLNSFSASYFFPVFPKLLISKESIWSGSSGVPGSVVS